MKKLKVKKMRKQKRVAIRRKKGEILELETPNGVQPEVKVKETTADGKVVIRPAVKVSKADLKKLEDIGISKRHIKMLGL